MPGYILTGAPGSGKTAVLRLLELNGHTVVEEAATDVIALRQALDQPRPWEEPGFIDDIVALQQRRQLAAGANAHAHGVTFFDRSPICTLALSRYAELTPSRYLLEEVARTVSEGDYQRTAFFIRNQGFIEPTGARRISFEDSLRFEAIHESTYRDMGFGLIEVAAAPLPSRVDLIQQTVDGLRRPSSTAPTMIRSVAPAEWKTDHRSGMFDAFNR